MGQRVEKLTGDGNITRYLYDAGQLAAEYTNAPVTDSGRRYLTTDHLGTTRVITDPTGTILTRRDYFPFGEEISPATLATGNLRSTISAYGDNAISSTTVRFTGKERDAETGLDYFGARYLSAVGGRFSSPDWSDRPDPIPYAELREPQTLNLFTYGRNSPLKNQDFDGHCTIDGEEHGYLWCLGHTLGLTLTRKEAATLEIRVARQFFSQTYVILDGEWVDPDKSTDEAILTKYNAYLSSLSVNQEPASFSADPSQLQAKFKHADDFGVKEPWNKKALAQFERAVANHVNDPATQVINGTYRGNPVVHHLNPQTGLNVMTDTGGRFISGWKLNAQQLQNVLSRGSL